MVDRQKLTELILEQSDAPLILQRVQDRLKEEQRKREAFYEIMDEDTKAEFIHGEIVYHSPVMKRHNDATGYLYTLLRTPVLATHNSGKTTQAKTTGLNVLPLNITIRITN